MEHHYFILGLRPGASDAEIKKAYRQLARRYHPDVSSEPDAEERFVAITEAYDYLLEKRYAPEPSIVYGFHREPEPQPDAEELRRKRARQYAHKRYEEFQRDMAAFRNAWYYTPLKITRFVTVYVLYAIALGMLLSPFIAWFVMHNGIAVFGFAFLAIISSQVYVVARSILKATKAYFDE